MAFAARLRETAAHGTKNFAEGAKALGAPVRIQEGALALPALFIRLVEEYKFSSMFLVQLLPFTDAAAERHVPEVRCTDGHMAKLYTAAADGSYLDVNVAHEHIEDPSGAKNFNGTPAKLSRFLRLATPYHLEAQTVMRVMCGTKTAPSSALEPIVLINAFVEPFERTDKKTKVPTGETAFSLHAGGYNKNVSLSEQVRGWPLTDRLRRFLPYEQQMLPTRDALFSDKRYQCAPYARLGPPPPAPPPHLVEPAVAPAIAVPAPAPQAVAEAPAAAADNTTTTNTTMRTLAPVRIDVSSFASWPDYYVLPSEEYTLAGATAQGMSAVATKVPIWSVRGNNTAAKPTDPPVYRKPKMGGNLVLGVTLTHELDKGDAAPAARTIAAEFNFFPEHLVNAPTWFMPLLDAITRGTSQRPPVPFVLQAAVDVARTQLDPRASDLFADGLVLMMMQQAPMWRLREYVERYGILVSEEATLDGRFSKGTGKNRFVPDKDKVEFWYDDAFEGRAERVKESLVRYDEVGNSEHCVLIDMLQGDIPEADRWPDGTRFYALPLYDKTPATAPLPRAPDAPDSAAAQLAVKAGLPDAMRPWRCALTTAASGDAYVRAELVALGRIPAAETKSLADVLAAKPGLMFPDAPNVKAEGDFAATLPYFCFFAVSPVPASAAAPVVQASRKHSAVVKREPAPVHESDASAVATGKRERDELPDGVEPAPKRARTEHASDADNDAPLMDDEDAMFDD
jgi:hypothetical protein